jgi:hypothetical protein
VTAQQPCLNQILRNDGDKYDDGKDRGRRIGGGKGVGGHTVWENPNSLIVDDFGAIGAIKTARRF